MYAMCRRLLPFDAKSIRTTTPTDGMTPTGPAGSAVFIVAAGGKERVLKAVPYTLMADGTLSPFTEAYASLLLSGEGGPHVDGVAATVVADTLVVGITMERLQADVRTLLQASPPPCAKTVRAYTDGCCRALRKVHAAGFAHGDAKPANFAVRDNGRIVAIDFGLAVPCDPTTQGAFAELAERGLVVCDDSVYVERLQEEVEALGPATLPWLDEMIEQASTGAARWTNSTAAAARGMLSRTPELADAVPALAAWSDPHGALRDMYTDRTSGVDLSAPCETPYEGWLRWRAIVVEGEDVEGGPNWVMRTYFCADPRKEWHMMRRSMHEASPVYRRLIATALRVHEHPTRAVVSRTDQDFFLLWHMFTHAVGSVAHAPEAERPNFSLMNEVSSMFTWLTRTGGA